MDDFTLTKIFAVICLAIICSSCATATRGSHETLMINSEPPGARALTNLPSKKKKSIDGYFGCEPTPCGISLPRKSMPLVTVSKAGHEAIKFKVTSSVATSATSIPKGAIVAGLPPGSYVQFGTPEFLKRFSAGSAVLTGGVLTLGTGAVLDMVVGANKNLTPNPVTVFLAPSTEVKK